MKISFESAILATARLRLEVVKLEDLESVFSHYGNPVVAQYLGSAPLKSLKQTHIWLESRLAQQAQGLGIVLTIKQRNSGQLIGMCALEGIDWAHHYATLGFSLSPNYWRQGFMREALIKFIGYLFEPNAKHVFNCLQRLQVWVRVENCACIQLIKQLGFVREGCFRKIFYWQGSYHDLYCFSLLRKEWVALFPI